MDQKTLRKLHPELFRLWVRHKFKFGDDPTPQKDKNYIISIVNDSRRCFVVLEYNDGWYSESEEDGNGNLSSQDINIPSKEIIIYTGIEKDENGNDIHPSENNFISLLTDIIRIYSTEDLENQSIVCVRTNGPGRIAFDAIRKETQAQDIENVQFFPTSRRSKYGKEIFKTQVKRLSQGWEMTTLDEKNCFDAMRTAQEQGYFILVADKSKQVFQLTSSEEQLEVEPFAFCWFMLSFIRLNVMQLFN